MIRYVLTEGKISISLSFVLFAGIVGVLRLAAVFSPDMAETWAVWVSALEVLFPALFPLVFFQLLEREKGWRTLDVLVATPRRKAIVFGVRTMLSIFPMIAVVMVAVPPSKYLAVLAPGLSLGGLCFAAGILMEEEIGLGASLAWWGISLAFLFRDLPFGDPRLLSWFVLLLSRAPLSPEELLMRRVAHLSVGLVLLGLSTVLADIKRSWFPR
ncbi:MAG: hypothetical protein NZ651_06375 [Candidatus Bipolaricaulota bacterium]|nr:hypothetical protein [Candidatus Bipolaricaulota bacterium]MDW8127380.1 hypothetical protein [Candidatus Bipolaricaulota bacterium]